MALRQGHLELIRWVSLAVLVIALLAIMRLLPVGEALGRAERWIDGLGIWGPLAFIGIYVLATVLLVPGSALTLAAGAIFGLWIGTAVVSVGATSGAAAAFLIARYVARRRAARLIAERPRLAAVDRAIGEQGWKIVVLLRLSPAVPFNIQNYLYGLTAIRFWPAVLASWAAMLPGTFMYVYLGHVGRQGLEAAAGAGEPASAARWALLIVGLLATIAVTVYVTRLATRAVQRSTKIDEAEKDGATAPAADHPAAPPRPWGALAAAALAIAAVVLAACAYASPETIRGLLRFGPPAVTAVEAYEQKPQGPSVDHGAFDALLKAHVREGGWVDYAALAAEPAPLDAYIAALGTAPFDELGRDEKLALLINAYNAFTLELIIEHWNGGALASIRDIEKPWDEVRWTIGGHTWSLNQIEHEQVRPKFAEPRIHFALVCAAVGCPPLRREAYTAAQLEQQLEAQARYVHEHETWCRFDAAGPTLHLTKLYDWYGGDFVQAAGSVPKYVARYVPALRALLDQGGAPKIEWIEYDWKLNSVGNTARR